MSGGSQLRQSISGRPENCGQNEVNSNHTFEIPIFLMDGSSVCLKLEGKRSAFTANEVLDKVCRQLNPQNNKNQLCFNEEYKKLFSIWITSPYLELQLQPSHKPFCVLSKWDSLLRKHGPTELIADQTLVERDEPTLTLQRNVFCEQSLETEIMEADIKALYLLYYETKLNVLDGRYPCDQLEQLAAYQAAIDFGQHNKTEYSAEYFRQHLKEYIPFNYIKGSDGNKINGLIRTLSRSTPSIRCAQSIHEKYKEISKIKLSEYKLLRSYLEICWKIPCYGSAYFSAQIERPIKSRIDSLVNHFDLEVWVAINQTGLHLISKEKPELLLSIDYLDLIWAVGSPESSNPNCIPCIYIQIPDQNDNILQIFSRQFRLIETLLTSFIKETKNSLNSRNNSISYSNRNSNSDSYDVTDGPIPAPQVVKPLYSQQISHISKTYKPERLSLAKFNSSGECLNKRGSWLRVKDNK